MQDDLFIQTPKSLEGVIDAVKAMDCHEGIKARAVYKLRELAADSQILSEYRQLMRKKENWGRSKQIMKELSVKYFNTEHKSDYVHDVIYRKYKPKRRIK